MESERKAKQHAFVMWIAWFAFLQSAFAIQLLVGEGLPKRENAAEPMASWLWVICFLPLVISTVLRWVVIPRSAARNGQFVVMIVGLALAEASVNFQLFLVGDGYPQNQIAILIIAIFCLIQFAPSYATPGYRTSSREFCE